VKMRTKYCKDCSYWKSEYEMYLNCPMFLTKRDELCFNKTLQLPFEQAVVLHECTTCGDEECPLRIYKPKEMGDIIIACSDYKFKGEDNDSEKGR